jgi:hypothetical protein
MPFVPVPNTAEVEAVYLLDGQIVENVLFFQHTGTPDAGSLSELVEAVNTAIRTQLVPLLSNAIQLLRLVGTLIDVADGLVYVSTTSLPATGGSGDESMPSNVAACMSFRTGHRGRSFRGRNFIPALPNGWISTNTITSTLSTSLTAAYTEILGAGADSGWVPVVVSRYSGYTIVSGKKKPTPRTTGIATPIIAHYFVDNTVDSQRRRLPGRGR